MAILHRKVQEAICQEIADAVRNIIEDLPDDATDRHRNEVCYVAEFSARNLYMRGLIEKEYAVQVFEATGGSMEDIEAWTKECKPGCGWKKRPEILIDSLMPDDIRERAASLGVATTIPTFTMAWVEDGKIHVGEFNSLDHAMNRIGIIERNQEEMRPKTLRCSKCKVDWNEECTITCPGCDKIFCQNCWDGDGEGEEGCHRHAFGEC